VRFDFSCALNPGVYFLNCGVTGFGGRQLHRIVDALAFRVLPISEVSTFGHVHFGHSASVSEEASRER
jgi:lipopolysaccharide transport system ATP-binding protein